MIKEKKPSHESINFKERALAGLMAGAFGAMVGNPADLALIRMQSDHLQPPELRSNYRNAGHAIYKIARQEGVLSLWTGASPTVARAMALNFGMLSTYAETKSQLSELFNEHNLKSYDSWIPYLSSGVAGFFASFCSLPFDFVKTRMQKQSAIYKSSMDCVAQVLKKEGPFAFYKVSLCHLPSLDSKLTFELNFYDESLWEGIRDLLFQNCTSCYDYFIGF